MEEGFDLGASSGEDSEGEVFAGAEQVDLTAPARALCAVIMCVREVDVFAPTSPHLSARVMHE